MSRKLVPALGILDNCEIEIETNNALPDRRQLVAYLSYSLDELALMNETSATLVRMAIAYLEEEVPMVPRHHG